MLSVCHLIQLLLVLLCFSSVYGVLIHVRERLGFNKTEEKEIKETVKDYCDKMSTSKMIGKCVNLTHEHLELTYPRDSITILIGEEQDIKARWLPGLDKVVLLTLDSNYTLLITATNRTLPYDNRLVKGSGLKNAGLNMTKDKLLSFQRVTSEEVRRNPTEYGVIAESIQKRINKLDHLDNSLGWQIVVTQEDWLAYKFQNPNNWACWRVAPELIAFQFCAWRNDKRPPSNKPTPTPPSCPKNWTRFVGRCYFGNSTRMTWDQANSYCKSLDSSLVKVSSIEVNAIALNLAYELGSGAIWTGGRWSGGRFAWPDNDNIGKNNVGYSNWHLGKQPDGGSGLCVELLPKSWYNHKGWDGHRGGVWNALDCGEKRAAVCQK